MSAERAIPRAVNGMARKMAMKVRTGGSEHLVDVIEFLKLDEVSIEKVSERLSGEDLDRFESLVTIAKLETRGQIKKARRLLVATLARSVGLDIVGAG